MKDTRKLSLVYFGISVILLLIFLCGCAEPNMEVDFIHEVNHVEVYYTDDIKSPYDGQYLAEFLISRGHDNFVIQCDSGMIEVENGEVVYNNIK